MRFYSLHVFDLCIDNNLMTSHDPVCFVSPLYRTIAVVLF